MGLCESFEYILTNYESAKSNRDVRRSVTQEMKKARSFLERIVLFNGKSNLVVGYSLGKIRMANVPWLAIRDLRISPRVTDGVLCAYLFEGDQSGLYLVIGQGAGADAGVPHGQTYLTALQSSAERLRSEFQTLKGTMFCVDDKIDLKVPRRGSLGSYYEAGTVAYKHYIRAAVPSDEKLLEDLNAALILYAEFADRAARRRRPWLLSVDDD